jgi:uncharacterized protein YcbX
MRVAELWRYPVKSLQGEQLDRAAVTEGGIVGERTRSSARRSTSAARDSTW